MNDLIDVMYLPVSCAKGDSAQSKWEMKSKRHSQLIRGEAPKRDCDSGLGASARLHISCLSIGTEAQN
jgi:hypothetical protein